MNHDDIIRVLDNACIFSGLDNAGLKEFAGMAVVSRLSAGDIIFREEDAPDRFYLIADGKVKVLKHSSSGKEFIIAFLKSGEMLGDVAIFENKPYPASAQALTETVLIAAGREDFLAFLLNHPRVAINITGIFAERLRIALGRLGDIAGERVEQRLAKVLVMLSAKFGTTIPFTRQEIAGMTGTTIETTIRIMTGLKNRGIIQARRGKVTIMDERKLRLLGEGPPEI